MSSTFEKSVKGATKLKLAPPKSKYVQHILQGTQSGEAGVAEVFRVLTLRLRDSTWTIAFKALIVIHLMIREGEPNVTLRYLSSDPRRIMSVSSYTDDMFLCFFKLFCGFFKLFCNAQRFPSRSIYAVNMAFTKICHVQTQGRNIKSYARYIIKRASGFQKSKVDYVLNGKNRLKALSVDKGLLRETEIVQDQIEALLDCDLLNDELDNNEITLTAFRLLTMDLLVLYQVMNEGTISVLEHYFEMSRPDAERALGIYKTFARLTQLVVKFLSMARAHQQDTRLEIPTLKHAPTSLAASLEEYLNDRDFETNRQQYIAQQQAKKGIKPTTALGASSSRSAPAPASAPKSQPQAAPQPTKSATPAKGPAPDLIDFFDSIEDNQQPMAQNTTQFQQQAFAPAFASFPQQTGQPPQMNQFGGSQQAQFAPQQAGNPFMQFQQQPQVQSQYTGAGFGGYTQQSLQQEPQTTSLAQNGGGFDQFGQPPFGGGQPLQEQPTNPFRKSSMPMLSGQNPGAFSPSSQQGGTNPFARSNTLPVELPGRAIPVENNAAPFGASAYASQPAFSPTPPPPPTQSPPPLQAQQTGTNPFARNQPPSAAQPQPPSSSLASSNATGNTNPFKNSAFVNQQTGMGWQTSQQNSMGGLEKMETIPVFPRPGQPQQQPPFGQQGQSPWG